MTSIETVRGFNDFTGKEAVKREVISQVIKNVFL